MMPRTVIAFTRNCGKTKTCSTCHQPIATCEVYTRSGFETYHWKCGNPNVGREPMYARFCDERLTDQGHQITCHNCWLVLRPGEKYVRTEDYAVGRSEGSMKLVATCVHCPPPCAYVSREGL